MNNQKAVVSRGSHDQAGVEHLGETGTALMFTYQCRQLPRKNI